MQDLPIIFVSDYKDISLDMVNKYKFESVNIEKLKFSWWLSLIQSQHNQKPTKRNQYQ